MNNKEPLYWLEDTMKKWYRKYGYPPQNYQVGQTLVEIMEEDLEREMWCEARQFWREVRDNPELGKIII